MTNQLSENRVESPKDTLAGESDLPLLPLTFIPITEYTTYRAELAITEGDMVFHFFVTPEIEALPDAQKYWLERFPAAMQKVATEYFNADYPALKAAYTEEQASWWLRAFGKGLVLGPHDAAYRFLALLDAELDKVFTVKAM